MNTMSDYDYNEDETCYDNGFHTSILGNNFTNLGYSASLKSMRYCKAKKNKPTH